VPSSPGVPPFTADAFEAHKQRTSVDDHLERIQNHWFDMECNLLGNSAETYTEYPPLAEFEARLPMRALSLRFQCIARYNGDAKAAAQWKQRYVHVACQTVIPSFFPLDVYTLAANGDASLARFYASIVVLGEAGLLDMTHVSAAPHRSFVCPSLGYLPNWWSISTWVREFRDERRKREKNRLAVCFADVESYSVPARQRPSYYCALPDFMKHELMPTVVPAPGVFYYLFHRVMRRSTERERQLSDYLLAVAKSEWFAAQAATWIQQIALGKKMMRLTPEYRAAFAALGGETPTRRTNDPWDPVRPITPELYERLLALHDSIDWDDPRYTLYEMSTDNVSHEAMTHRWVPINLQRECVDWGSPWFGVGPSTVVPRYFLRDPEWVPITSLIPGTGAISIRLLMQAAQSAAVNRGAFLSPSGEASSSARSVDNLQRQVLALKDQVQTLTQEKATLVTEKMETDQGKGRLEGLLTDLQTQKHAVDVALATALRGKKKATLLFREKESALRASAAENASQAGQLEEATERVAVDGRFGPCRTDGGFLC